MPGSDREGWRRRADLKGRQPLPIDAPRKLLVLVVERDPNMRELESHFLAEAGYVVEFASDGREAADRARTMVPDVVITEILVPVLDGLSLCRELKANPATRGIRVLVFSILAAESRAHEAGADAFLLKPLAAHTLIATVERLLGTAPRKENKP
jgi:two-component system response regulator MprA